MDKQIVLSRLSFIAACFAFLVIGLGAYTRLTDAGLGCPDWPGCYRHLLVPNSKHALQKANLNFPNNPLNAKKAWIEMIHRYFASVLGIMILAISLIAFSLSFKQGIKFLILGTFLFALLIYQSILGMLTVTLKLLPLMVSQHLLGGMILFASLWLTYLLSRPNQNLSDASLTKKFKPWVFLGLLLVLVVISLGAWTSANYAALSCPNFPYCRNDITWHYDFQNAFDVFSPLGIDYQGGVLSGTARMTIHMIHRLGAMTVLFYLLGLIFFIHWQRPADNRLVKVSRYLMVFLVIQISLGISNVLFKLPLFIAVAHNLCAALLLIIMISLNYRVFAEKETL